MNITELFTKQDISCGNIYYKSLYIETIKYTVIFVSNIKIFT